MFQVIVMEFGLNKCDVLIMKKGEIATFGGIILTEKDSLKLLLRVINIKYGCFTLLLCTCTQGLILE